MINNFPFQPRTCPDQGSKSLNSTLCLLSNGEVGSADGAMVIGIHFRFFSDVSFLAKIGQPPLSSGIDICFGFFLMEEFRLHPVDN